MAHVRIGEAHLQSMGAAHHSQILNERLLLVQVARARLAHIDDVGDADLRRAADILHRQSGDECAGVELVVLRRAIHAQMQISDARLAEHRGAKGMIQA